MSGNKQIMICGGYIRINSALGNKITHVENVELDKPVRKGRKKYTLQEITKLENGINDLKKMLKNDGRFMILGNMILCKRTLNWYSESDILSILDSVGVFVRKKTSQAFLAIDKDGNTLKINFDSNGNPKIKSSTWRFKHCYKRKGEK